ncbi:MAG: sigma 54-interacting transcriptional regulator [Nannocystaceae bacterium]
MPSAPPTGTPTVPEFAPTASVPAERRPATVERRPLAAERRPAAAEFAPSAIVRFGPLIAVSSAMKSLFSVCERLAVSDVTLVIEGETGTGKSLLAESIHRAGHRGAGPYVVVDCSTLDASLAEATLFGYAQGSYLGPAAARPGVFEQANGGTLVLDEVAELDRDVQVRLLRIVEAGRVCRVGSDQEMPFDVRVIATSRASLAAEARSGRFREELFFRLAVTQVEVPPLRDRGEDLDALFRHFWALSTSLPCPTLDGRLTRFREHRWSGNLRELQNVVTRCMALGPLVADDPYLIDPMLTRRADERGDSGGSLPVGRGATDAVERILGLNLPLPRARQRLVAEFERRYVERVLRLHDGNVARAAEASGIARRYFRLLRARIREQSQSV